MKLYENESTTYQNLSDAANTVVRGTFIALISYISKGEITQIKELSFHYRKAEKKIKSKTSKKNRKIKIRAKINKTEKRKQYTKINKPNDGF